MCGKEKAIELFRIERGKYRNPCRDCKNTKDKEYNNNNKDKRNKRRNKRLKTDPEFKLRSTVSASIYRALKRTGSSKGGSILDYLPYTIKKLKKHIESQFHPWMNWDNNGIQKEGGERKWHIDHIIPQSDLPYDSMDHPNFKKCWALKNLRPVDAAMNLKKGISTQYDKLVRDKIPEVLDAKGIEYHSYKISSEKDYWEKLKMKLQEEVAEFCEAKTKETRTEEAADILEVMDAILDKIGADGVMKIKKEKIKTKGGFSERIILLETIE